MRKGVRFIGGRESMQVVIEPQILRTMTREEAVAIRTKANAEGKNKGFGSTTFNTVEMPQGEYLLISMPLSLIDYIHQNEDRERAYAERGGEFPPINAFYSSWSAKRGRRQAYAGDGNHRCCAAELRGNAAIPTIMEKVAYERFIGVINGL